MTAEEAREKTKLFKTQREELQLEYITSKILEQIRKGVFSTFVKSHIEEVNLKKLSELGYKITPIVKDILYKISWAE